MNPRNLLTCALLIGLHGLALPLVAQSGHSSVDHGGAASRADDGLGDLPLSLNPAPAGSTLVVLLSGDGGWAAGDQSLAKAFVADSVAVVGLSSPRYLEHQRTPDEAAGDLARIIRHFGSSWSRDRVIVVGYSRGADIGPFMVSRLPADLRKRVTMLVLLGPGPHASFKFSLLDLTRSHHGDDSLPVEPQVAALHDIPVLCIYGATDRGAICQDLAQAGLAHALRRSGGHVVHGNEGPALVNRILAETRASR